MLDENTELEAQTMEQDSKPINEALISLFGPNILHVNIFTSCHPYKKHWEDNETGVERSLVLCMGPNDSHKSPSETCLCSPSAHKLLPQIYHQREEERGLEILVELQ